jgi:hypothetical protein
MNSHLWTSSKEDAVRRRAAPLPPLWSSTVSFESIDPERNRYRRYR